MIQAWDVKRKRIVNVERIGENGEIIMYSLLDDPGSKYLPLIDENGNNVEPYEILEHEQISMFGGQ
jgi:hypothetical protein